MTFRAMPGQRKYHRAKLAGPNGEISPLCAKKPRAIDMSVESTETWTLLDTQVTCRACKAAIAKAKAAP